ESSLVERVSSNDPDLRMPPEGERLTRVQIETLRRWIDADLPWEVGFAFGKSSRQAPLAPRRPEVPDGSAGKVPANAIDRFLREYLVTHQLEADKIVSDPVC